MTILGSRSRIVNWLSEKDRGLFLDECDLCGPLSRLAVRK